MKRSTDSKEHLIGDKKAHSGNRQALQPARQENRLVSFHGNPS